MKGDAILLNYVLFKVYCKQIIVIVSNFHFFMS